MAEQHPIQGMMETSMGKIREMIDVNSIMGDPITTPDGTTIIPVTKVTFGFGSGGSDIPAKGVTKEVFGGGAGAGITMQPLAFLVIHGGEVKLLQMSSESNTATNVINMVPEVIDKLKVMFTKEGKQPTQD